MKDLRIEVRFRNAVLLNALEQAFGHLRSAAYNDNPGILLKASAIIGVNHQWLYRIINLKEDVRYSQNGKGGRAGTYKKRVILVADALGCSPEELFPDVLYAEKFKRKLVAEVDSATVVSLDSVKNILLAQSSEDDERKTEAREAIAKTLLTLRDRDRKTIEMAFALGEYSQEHSNDEIGKELGVTGSRVHQILSKAMRQLRHPSRAYPLREFL